MLVYEAGLVIVSGIAELVFSVVTVGVLVSGKVNVDDPLEIDVAGELAVVVGICLVSPEVVAVVIGVAADELVTGGVVVIVMCFVVVLKKVVVGIVVVGVIVVVVSFSSLLVVVDFVVVVADGVMVVIVVDDGLAVVDVWFNTVIVRGVVVFSYKSNNVDVTDVSAAEVIDTDFNEEVVDFVGIVGIVPVETVLVSTITHYNVLHYI